MNSVGMLNKGKRFIKDAIKSVIVFAIQGCFYLLGHDDTNIIATGPILVIAPHPDDETLGCGASIAKARELGQKVRVVIVTDGRASGYKPPTTPDQVAAMRRDEALAAIQILGVGAEDVVFLEVPDGNAAQHIAQIEEGLARQIETIQPRLIFSPYGIDEHPDHRAVAEAMEKACRKVPGTRRIFEYPVWFWLHHALAMITHPERARQLRYVKTRAYTRRKRAAMEAYRSQFPHLVGEDCTYSYFPPFSFRAQYLNDYEVFFEKPPVADRAGA
ncbi:MAG: PIG-L family deacetylase [Alphaproteobacteria bacterium]|nr:PIG-L family deacetylase [Alphaproteobacteria bacterium]